MRIVVRGTNWVGDAVMQIPALRRLRQSFPASHITLASRSWAQGIFRDADFIDDILPFEKSDSIFQQAAAWRKGTFDIAILFTNSFESALVARLGFSGKIYGYATEGRSFLLSESFDVPDWKNSRHEIYYYLNLAAKVEKIISGTKYISETEPRFELNVSAQRQAEARAFLHENKIDPSKKLVAMCAGSTNSRAKRWSADSYAKLNDRLQIEIGAEVFLIGSKDEADVAEEVFIKSKLKPKNIVGKTSLAEVTAILSVANLLISNDTGPAHIGAAVGAKTLTIFGPTNPLTTRPWNAEIIRREVECSPCMLRDCPIDHRCMTGISAKQVYEKAFELLNG